MPDILVIELELVGGLEGDPVHKKLSIFVNNFAVHQPRHYLVDHYFVKLLQDELQHLAHPYVADLVLVVDVVYDNPTPHVVADYCIYELQQLGEEKLVFYQFGFYGRQSEMLALQEIVLN